MKIILGVLAAAALSFSTGAALAEMQPIPNPPEHAHGMHGYHHAQKWHRHHHTRAIVHQHR